jgi:hypothetical protein
MRLGVIGGIFGVNGQAHTEEEPPMALPQSAVSELLEAAVSECRVTQRWVGNRVGGSWS